MNTLGAATISVLQKSLGTFHFPFVFGGDGATALIHESDLEKATRSLVSLRELAKMQFAMNLRIGIIPVAKVYQAQQNIEVAKFFMNPQKSIAMIRGGGLSWADEKIKAEPEKYGVKATSQGRQSLEGLSCRWQPLQSKRGQVLTLLVKPALDQDHIILKLIIEKMNEIFQNNFNRASPIQNDHMKYKSFIQCLRDEWNYESQHLSLSFAKRVFSILISQWAFKFKLPIFFDSESYKGSISTHSDYRKFDDILRMVVDCTNHEIASIEDFINTLHKSGKIFYGTHFSDHSIMTCLVENLQQGGHIHFIDGGDGGYAMAAKQLKEQVRHHIRTSLQEAT